MELYCVEFCTVADPHKVRGHKRQTIDPDMGHWFYTYNALGELIEQKDAKNQITKFLYDNKFLYDKLRRLKERQEPEGSNTRISTWVYDTATKGIGKLASETSRLGTSGSIDFRRTYTYDSNSGRAGAVTSTGREVIRGRYKRRLINFIVLHPVALKHSFSRSF